MALVVEDGTGKADAESYISVADATAYHADRGNAAWASLASDTVREQLLRKATDFMLQRYRMRWQGARIDNVQALDWPRSGVVVDPGFPYQYTVDDDVVPTEVKRACAELALKASSGDLMADLTQGKRYVKVGQIETEYDTATSRQKKYSAVDAMIAPFLFVPFGSLAVVRT